MKRLHALLLILLMFTVPLQAMAGRIMSCESRHVAASTAASFTMQEAHGIQGHALPAYQHDTQASDLAYLPADHDHHAAVHDVPPDRSAAAEPVSASCNACTACPMGVLGIAIGEYQLPLIALSSAGIAYSAFHIPETEPELPDDPPRA